MNDVQELREFAYVHARSQQIPGEVITEVLGRVAHDGDGAGSWVHEWSASATDAERAGDLLGAARRWTMARFPYVDGPARQEAWERAGFAFERWCLAENADLEPFSLNLSAGDLRGWTSGPPGDAPFVLLMGGIVSTKEQWATVLLRLRRFGIAGVVTEMPGVGHNRLPYDADAWQMIPALLDELKPVLAGRPVQALAMSFSGHLALRAALDDGRLASVSTIGAPVSAVFRDPAWQARLPRVTIDALASMAGVDVADLAGRLAGHELTGADLARLQVPVSYIASRRDEVIPGSDIALLRAHVRQLTLLENDDVHGSPSHLAETGPWLTRAVLRAHGSGRAQRAVISALLPLLRLRTSISA